MKYLSLFSGIGGFEKGIQQVHPDWECVGYSEIDKYAIQVYEKHFKHKNYGDITTVNTAELPDFDLLVGGFPCQAFSIAGKRRGFDEARGTLFFEIARILRDKRPRYFVLENVKGLLSHDGGKTLQTIFRILADLGYEFEWQVLNSKNFGVPQNRERIFISGHLRNERRSKIFPIRETTTETLKQLVGGSQGMRVYDSSGIATTQASQAGGLGAKTGLRAVDMTRRAKHGYKVRKDNTMSTITSTYYKGTGNAERPGVAVPAQWRRTEKGKEFRRESQKKGKDLTPFNDGYRELVPKDSNIIGTITSQAIAKDSLLFEIKVIGNIYPSGGENGDVLDVEGISKTLKSGVTDNPNNGGIGSSNSPKIMQDYKIRRLTPKECERLQGFPDNWTDILSDTQRYKTLGNAVTVNVIKTIFERF